MNNRRGISLVILIITLIIFSFIVAVPIFNITKSNLINNASEVTFKDNVTTFKEELAVNIFKKQTLLGLEFNCNNVNAIWYDIITIDSEESAIITYWIPSFTEEYKDMLVVSKGELKYITAAVNEEQQEWLAEIGISPLSE